jgi:hypothetical protein
MDFIDAAVAISLALQALLVFLLLRGPVRKYFIVFLYSVVYLSTSAIELIVFRQGGRLTPLYARVYWTDEIVLDLLLFLMVIILTLRATKESPLRAAVVRMLMVVAVAALALPFVIGPSPYFSIRWFRLASQILNFGGALMNLGLWTALIGSKKREPELLVVSAGLGVAVAGQAIYYGIRLLTASPVVRRFSDLLNVLTHLAGVAIWCWAFRRQARTRKGPPATVTTTSA